MFIESVAVGEMVYTINAAPLEYAENNMIIGVESPNDADTIISCSVCSDNFNYIGHTGPDKNTEGFADCLKFPTA